MNPLKVFKTVKDTSGVEFSMNQLVLGDVSDTVNSLKTFTPVFTYYVKIVSVVLFARTSIDYNTKWNLMPYQ